MKKVCLVLFATQSCQHNEHRANFIFSLVISIDKEKQTFQKQEFQQRVIYYKQLIY